MKDRPFIVGIGGTIRPNSSSERALRACLRILSAAGAHTAMFSNTSLILPIYEPGAAARSPSAAHIVEALRQCDGLVIASPAYHGSISGMLKNALDYAEDLREDVRPYLEGRVVGCIACAQGPQAAVTTLTHLRSVVHALRGWPTPMGCALNTSTEIIDSDGNCLDASVKQQLEIVCNQILHFAKSARLRNDSALDSEVMTAAVGPQSLDR